MAGNQRARPIGLRAIHKWSGLFFAPAILFFSLTGAVQTLDLHKAWPNQASPPEVVRRLASLHKNQTATVAPRPATAPARAAGRREPGGAASIIVTVLKAFVLCMSVALSCTTALGVWMAVKLPRSRRRALLVLAAGALLPALAAWFS
ncbi:hypothetical protein DJ021_17155 [Phenylobacterium hankyongense]|uniref:PepSY domain-containing protein n=1 Tax=Phenylobacterium hankyongense TaxID=1813876 RepID=A0A328B3J4_9CAUL|nr:hypothetical protein [Phenylobacterium hankyongense]RAK61407.1 hypothetical protein DJ021_17155 [Phenylobacterium hankyongense]